MPRSRLPDGHRNSTLRMMLALAIYIAAFVMGAWIVALASGQFVVEEETSGQESVLPLMIVTAIGAAAIWPARTNCRLMIVAAAFSGTSGGASFLCGLWFANSPSLIVSYGIALAVSWTATRMYCSFENLLDELSRNSDTS